MQCSLFRNSHICLVKQAYVHICKEVLVFIYIPSTQRAKQAELRPGNPDLPLTIPSPSCLSGSKSYISFFRQWQRDRPKLGANYIYLSDLFAGKLEQQEDRHWTETPRGNFILQNKPRAYRKYNVERLDVSLCLITLIPCLSDCWAVSMLSWKGSAFWSGLPFTPLHSEVLLRTI